MSGALMNKVWDLFGMDQAEPEEYDDENVYEYEDEEEETEVEDRKLFGRKNKVVPMQQAQGNSIKMVISQPTTFEQSDEICSFIKEKKSVIVNLEYVNKDVARRIVDFISGGVYALDGYIQKISNSIFLVAPSNYEITNEMAREEMKNKLSVSWLKNNGELAERTIIKPIDSNSKIVISKVKSIGLFRKLEKVFSFLFFAIFFSFLRNFLYIYITDFSPITHKTNVNKLNTITTLFSFHPDNSK